jgi:hypothetical protein
MSIDNCVFTVSLDLIMLPYLIKLSPNNITANMFTMAPSGPVCTFVHKTTKNSDVRASPSPVHKSTAARETAQTTVRIRKRGGGVGLPLPRSLFPGRGHPTTTQAWEGNRGLRCSTMAGPGHPSQMFYFPGNTNI